MADALRDSGLAPEYLKLEITETVAMDSGRGTIHTLQALKGLGVRLVIDDFGTGYSSLAYLKRFPVDTLKVDRASVDGLGQDPQAAAIGRSVIAMAGSLSLTVTVEGIETPGQLATLHALNSEGGQGYLFAQPRPAAEIRSIGRTPRADGVHTCGRAA